MRDNGQGRKRFFVLSLMVVTVVAVVAYGTAVAANLAHAPMSDPENPNPSPSPSVQFPLVVHVVGSGEGHVVIHGVGKSCGGVCTVKVDAGTVLGLEADADSGSTFDTWGGACHGSGDCKLTMVLAHVVVAVFTKAHHLAVTHSGRGWITNTSGIHCPPDCGQPYRPNATVHLYHHAAPGWHFVRWSGACHGTKACVVKMKSAHLVHAAFVRSRHTH